MTKEDWLLVLTAIILIVTSYGVYITYESTHPLPSESRIYFSAFTHKYEEGLPFYICYEERCKFAYEKDIIEGDLYYTASMYMSNYGERIHNVVVSFRCDDIDFYGISKRFDSNIDIRGAYKGGSELYFPELDSINSRTWDMIFKINDTPTNFSCRINYVADELTDNREILVKVD